MSDTTPQTRIQQKNRSAILAAGLDVFSQFGFRGTTLDQIAKAAGLSKPNLLYYFNSKEAIYTELLTTLLKTWLDPLIALDAAGDPVTEIINYAKRKLRMSRDFPRESRLFANEILQGAPHISDALEGALKTLVTEKVLVIRHWHQQGKIADVDPHHLIFSIWSMTQHYADFDVQIRAILGDEDPIPQAEIHIENMLRRMLAPMT